MKIINEIEKKSFHCDTLQRYDFWNNKLTYLCPVFIPYIDIFLVKEIGISPPKWEGGRDFCVVLTHDVDTIGEKKEILRKEKKKMKEEIIRMKKDNIEKKEFYFMKTIFELRYFALQMFLQLMKKNNKEKFPIEKWLEFEEKLGVKSTFFFFPQAEENETVYYDCAYKYEDKIDFYGRKTPLYEAIKEIKKLGWDIGIHGSILSARNLSILKKQKERTEKILGFSVKSIRHHYLSFDPTHTPYIQKKVGFEYDSTFGFNISVGFRAGTSYPFDWEKEENREGSSEKIIGSTEISPVIQDGALFWKRSGMGLGRKEAMKLCFFIADEVKKVGGVLTIIWHTNFFNTSGEIPGDVKFLLEFVKYCKNQGAWITSLEKAVKYWRKNHQKKIDLKQVSLEEIIKFSISYMKGIYKKLYSIF